MLSFTWTSYTFSAHAHQYRMGRPNRIL